MNTIHRLCLAMILTVGLIPGFTVPAWAALTYSWQEVNPLPTPDEIGALASNGGGVVVAVSKQGTLLRSGDGGTTWGQVKTATGCLTVYWSAAHSRFVAMGNWSNGSFTSPDGLTWSPTTRPNSYPVQALAEGNGILVAVGGGSSIWTSSNGGANWVSQNQVVPGTLSSLDHVAWNGSLFVAVGGYTRAQLLVTSPDGVTWTQQDVATAIATLPTVSATTPLGGVVWDGARWVVTTRDLYSLVSADGVTWSALTTSPTAGTNTYAKALGWNGLQYCAVGQYGAFVSNDGVTWNHTLTAPQANYFLKTVAWDGAQWIAGGSGGTLYTSPDGTTWTERSQGIHDDLNRAAFAGGLYVVVGFAGRIATSPDGVAWTVQTSNTIETLNDIVWTGAQFVAVGNNGAVVTSPDGIAWSPQVGLTGNRLTVAWNGVTLVAVGDQGGVAAAWTSTDGATWTPSSNGGLGSNVNDLIWEPTLGLFVQVGFSGGGIATSPDGIVWTPQNSNTTGTLLGVTSDGNGRLVTVGIGTPNVLVSTDAVTWSPVTFPSYGTRSISIVWDGSRYLIPINVTVNSKPTIYTSTDGVTWSKTATNIGGIAGKGALFEPSSGQYLTVDTFGHISLGAVLPNHPPAFATPPTIKTQNVAVGDTLSLLNANAQDPDNDVLTYTYVWRNNGVAIPGATAAFYAMTPSDAGASLDCTITVDDNLGGVATATTPPVTIANHRPTFTGTPTLASTGNNVGDVVSLTNLGTSDVDGDTVTLTYQWYLDGWLPIASATGPTFTITVNELGFGLSCDITADDGNGGLTTVTSDSLALFNNPPVFVTPPTVSNISSTVGTVVEVQATVTDDNPFSTPVMTYQWRAAGVDIPGATALDYTIAPADIGVAIDCVVTADDQSGGVTTATTAPYIPGNGVPTFDEYPEIANAGPVAVGDLLTLQFTAATDPNGDLLTTTYRWQADGVDIPGATGPTYTVANTDLNAMVTCVVTATDPFGGFAQHQTAPVQPGNLPPAFTGTPAIANLNPHVGDTLTLADGFASDPNGDTVNFYYQWRHNGAVITGVGTNGPTLTVTPALAHQNIDCLIFINDGKSNPVQATTAAIAVGNTAPSFDATPAIANSSAVAGDTLSLSGVATSDPDGDTVTLSYQWRSDGVDLTGETGATLAVAATHEGHAISVALSANDGQGGITAVTVAALTIPAANTTAGGTTGDGSAGGGGGGCFIGTVGF